MSLDLARAKMVDRQLMERGIADRRVLDAFREVPREAFIADELAEFAYEDTPLPIGEEQTISQPYIVAVTVEALALSGAERVLEVGTGSGYAAAVLSRLAREVFTVERHAVLAAEARERLARLGYDNVHVLEGDGSLGWPEHAPYEAIAVAASAPRVPRALREQLAAGGRLVIPVSTGRRQALMLVTRETADSFTEKTITGVRFVPLVGEQGYPEGERVLRPPRPAIKSQGVASLLRDTAEPITERGGRAIDALVERIGDARVVLLGEATHGTSEFYRMRARITRALIEKQGFNFVAVEADWPDAARIDDYVLGSTRPPKLAFTPFARFPTWMWRNQETLDFVNWLRAHNARQQSAERGVGFHGLDLYSMYTSIAAVLAYLDDVDPAAAGLARERYAELLPWQHDPAGYGRAVLVGERSSSEDAVVKMLRDLLERRLEYSLKDGRRYFDAAQNARVVAHAERYYRAMYYGSAESWNLRDAHMFTTLLTLLDSYGEGARGVVWEHNSHVGDATATEMSSRGELNVGQLCRVRFDAGAYIVGFGTDHGTVAAASRWGAPMQEMQVRPAHVDSYERLCHDVSRPAFMLHLREPERAAVRDELMAPRLERAIGVIYRPDSELASHYFHASLPLQFDEYVWFDETRAVSPLPAPAARSADLPETYPFGL